MKRFFTLRALCLSAVTAALYAGLCLLLPAFSYGALQVRISEALTLLPVVWPETVPGLTLGCFLANLFAGNTWDLIFGTLATLLAAVLTRRLRKKPLLAALAPVLVNGVVIGLVLTYGYGIPMLPLHMLTVAGGEAIAVFALGLPLIRLLSRYQMKSDV